MDGFRIEQAGEDVLIWIKAVPGASRNEITGVIGDRLKVRISAPPEGGKANRAICKIVAQALGVKTQQVTIEKGQTKLEKLLCVSGVDAQMVRSRLAKPQAALGD
ncbi:MAG: YggU family protein [Planctomycetes bacterium]|nr:YggU family protein [Planctomycetota bacterium]